MRNNSGRSSLNGSSPTFKKPASLKVSTLTRAHSLRSTVKVPSPDQSPILAPLSPPLPRKAPPVLKLPAIYTDNSRLEALKLPKTEPPSPNRHYALKKRFGEVASRLDRIPCEDWLDALLCCHPEFSRALASNLERCKEKLARSKLVRAAILEEDGDISDQSRRSKRGEQSCCYNY